MSKQMNPKTYDLCVIGCGPGGFAGAMRAVDFAKRVCIIEQNEIGGAAVKWGALSSKTLWELAKDYAVASKVDRGYRATGLSIDYQEVKNTVLAAVKEKQYQMRSQLETFAEGRFPDTPGGIRLIKGKAYFATEDAVIVENVNGETETIYADHFLIATGSRPSSFSNIVVDQKFIFNSDGILSLNAFPKRMAIVGAGIIGCEYASIFSNFNQTTVYLIDHKERVIPFEDPDVSTFVSNNLIKNGVRILHSVNVREINPESGYVEIILDYHSGYTQIIEVDMVLLSVGRTPNTNHLNLSSAGITLDSNGYLKTDVNMCVKGRIYASGDVTHRAALVNMAEMESRIAVEHMFGASPLPLNYSNMSTIMFFSPAVAAVGLNEQACQLKKIPYKAAWYANALVPRAIAMRALDGFVKILVTEDENRLILGMRAAGPQVSSTITSIALLMDHLMGQMGCKGIRDILKTLHPHPTISEGIQECLRLLLDNSIYKPKAFPDLIKILNWHPDNGYY